MKNYYQNSRKILRRHKKRNYKKAPLLALTVLILFSGLISLLYIPKFKIKNITIQGNFLLSNKVSEFTREKLNKKTFLIIPNDNIFTLRKKLVSKALYENFPQIKSVVLDKDFPDGLNIAVNEKQKIGIYCPVKPVEAGTEEKNEICFFIDENGFGTEEISAPDAQKIINKKEAIALQKENSPEFKKEDKFLKKDELLSILNFIENIKTIGFSTEKIVFKNDSLHNYEIYFGEERRFLLDKEMLELGETAFQNLKLILEAELKNKKENLEYIDLRFVNKAFYKLK